MTAETEQLAEIMGRRLDRLANLAYLCRRQLELIESGDLAVLLKVLSSKQRLLGELQTLERALDPFREQRPEDRRWLSPERRDACSRDIAEANRLLKEIFQIEQRSSVSLHERRDAAAAGLARLHSAQEARGAYLEAPAAPLRRLDLTSDV
jgi:flagellar biosynthesis/type III secretory pathway chaperone